MEENDGVEKLVMKDHDFFDSIFTKNAKKLYEYGADYDVIFQKDNPDNIIDKKCFGKVSKIRTSGLPLKYSMSKLEEKDLGLLDDEGLFEPCHFAVFDGKIMLSEFNFYGPRVRPTVENLLNKYLKENTTGNIQEIQINPILRDDPLGTINSFNEMRNIEFRVATDYAQKIMEEQDEHNSFSKMFSSAELVEEMFLTLNFSLGNKRPKDSLQYFRPIINIAKNLVSRDDFTDGVKTLKLNGKQIGEDDLSSINLAEQIFKTKRRITKLDTKTKAVDSEEMYLELMSLYINNKDELQKYIIGDN